MVKIVLSANSLRRSIRGKSFEVVCRILSDGLSYQFVSSVIHAGGSLKVVNEQRPCLEVRGLRTSSIRSTLERFRMARAMQSNCFSLYVVILIIMAEGNCYNT